MTWLTVGVTMALSLVGSAIAYMVALSFGQSSIDSRTISIEAGVQNTTIAALIVSTSMPSPESDLAVVIPMSSFLTTPVIFFSWMIIRFMRKKFSTLETPKKCLDQEERERREEIPNPIKEVLQAVCEEIKIEADKHVDLSMFDRTQ